MSSASTSASSDWWCGGSGQVKWLTDVVAGGKSNDWLMQWYGNALCLALALAVAVAVALALALVLDTSHLAKLSLPNILNNMITSSVLPDTVC